MNTTSKAILLKLISLNISLNPGLRKIMVQIVRFDAKWHIANENIWFDLFNSVQPFIEYLKIAIRLKFDLKELILTGLIELMGL